MAKKNENLALMVIVFIIIFLLMVWVFQQIWNWAVPEIFPGINSISYMQAVAVLFLASVLFSPLVIVNNCKKDE